MNGLGTERNRNAPSILVIGGLVPWHPRAGGGQVIAFKLSEALARSGHRIHYIAAAPEELRREIDWGRISYISETKDGLARFMERSYEVGNKYDIVHFHTSGELITHGVRKRLVRDSKLVVGMYAPRVHQFPALRSLEEFADFFNCHMADLILSLSGYSRENIAGSYFIPRRKIGVMYGGVDDSFFSPPERYAGKTKGFTLLFCGRLNGPHQQKGVDILLKAMPLILKERPVTLEIIGTGPRAKEYQALSKKLGIQNSVKFLGFVTYDKLPEYYSSADLFVLPTRRESFGLTLAEAMASGLPVVSSNITAVPEVVMDGETGVLVPPNDSEKLAQAVNLLLSQPDKMRLMGKKGQARAKEFFTWEKVADKVTRFYREILREPRDRTSS